MRKTALGKGLSALIPEDLKYKSTGKFRTVELSQLEPNPEQPREIFDDAQLTKLAESISREGMLQPIVVRQVDSRLQIVAGERRYRAAGRAGVGSVPVMVLENLTSQDMLEISLVENLQRQDLNPIELAKGYDRLIHQFALTQEELAERVGKERSSVANTLRLLQLPSEIQDRLSSGELREGHARAILALHSEKEQLELARRIIADELSVRAIEEIVYGAKKRKRGRSLKLRSKSVEIADAENALQQKLGTQVIIQRGLRRGKISIQFYGDNDLTRILELLGVHI